MRHVVIPRVTRLLFIVALPVLATAQAAPTIKIGAPEVTHPAEWTEVAGIRELRDGRLIVVDPRERAVKLVDLAAGTARMIGRNGSGPREYVLPTFLYALGGDSSVVIDFGNANRALVILPDGTPGGFLDPQKYAGFMDEGTKMDARGNAYQAAGAYAPIGSKGANGPPIRRLNLTSRKVDVIAAVSRHRVCGFSQPATARPEREKFAAASGRGPRPFLTLEQWAIAPDGRVAIVCPDPYRVTIIAPDGTRKDGPLIPYEQLAVNAEDKEAWIESLNAPVLQMSVNNGKMVVGYSRVDREPPQASDWPEKLPPFIPVRNLDGAAMFSPDGMLWVRRLVNAGRPALYDVIDRDGRLSHRVELPPQTRIVSFGSRGIYAVHADENDVQRLRRLRFPTMTNR